MRMEGFEPSVGVSPPASEAGASPVAPHPQVGGPAAARIDRSLTERLEHLLAPVVRLELRDERIPEHADRDL